MANSLSLNKKLILQHLGNITLYCNMSLISNLIECVDTFLDTGKTRFEINEGVIVFFREPKTKLNKNVICIQGFFLEPEFQNKGILTKFLKYLSEKFNEIWFLQCNAKMALILMTTKLNDKYFINKYTGEHCWIKNNDNYDAVKINKIYNSLCPLKKALKTDEKQFYELLASGMYHEFF